jgi:copper homeostasis protein CutC
MLHDDEEAHDMILETEVTDLVTLERVVNSGVKRIKMIATIDHHGQLNDQNLLDTAVSLTQAASVELVISIWPRHGGYHYDFHDVEESIRLLQQLRAHGVKTVSFGVLDEKNQLARDKMIKLIEAAGSMSVVYQFSTNDVSDDAYQKAVQWLERYGAKH